MKSKPSRTSSTVISLCRFSMRDLDSDQSAPEASLPPYYDSLIGKNVNPKKRNSLNSFAIRVKVCWEITLAF